MAETPSPPANSSEPSTPPSSTANQVRTRKERREAKIKAGGSARLQKLSGLAGGFQRDPLPQAPIASPSSTTPASHNTSNRSEAADPEEVDISDHFYQPASSTRARVSQYQGSQDERQQISDEQLRAIMLGFPPSGRGTPLPSAGGGVGSAGNPFAGFAGIESMGMGGMGGVGGVGGKGDDPIMKLLQQMMGGGAGGMPGEGLNGMSSFPGMAGMPGQAGDVAVADPYAYVWRIVHAIFALTLGLYVAFTAEFTGTKLSRDLSAVESVTGRPGWGLSSTRFFYIFATVEVLLQTSRFFLEKGTVQPGGIVGMVMGFLPRPWKGYLALMLRYGRIWTTVSGDAMVCVFVLGVCSWLRGP